MRVSISLLVLASLLIGASCSTKPRTIRTDPYQISKKEFKKTVRIIAIAPVTIPDGLPDPAPIQEEFDSLITVRLRGYGYTIVRPHEYTAVWNRLAVEMGGFEDPDSGGIDEEKMTAAMFKTLEVLKAGFELDAVLFPGIFVVEAQFVAGNAAWDGADQRIETASGVETLFSGSQAGVVDAISLKVNIRGKDGTPLYIRSGGIEVLTKVFGKEFISVPRPDLFTDKERNSKAVKIALSPLKH